MEQRAGWLTSGAFAALCATTRETLRHYRDLGLLAPAHRGENGYFYYDAEQFYDFYAISIFRQTGTPLEEIRRCLRGQDTAQTLDLLREQRSRLEAERRKLEQMEFVLSGMIEGLELGTAPDLIPRTGRFGAERLLALPVEELEGLMDPRAGEDAMLMTVLERCRELCREYELRTDYRLGAIHRPGEPAGPETISHLTIRIAERAECPYYQEKPAGTYLYLCCRGRWDLSRGYAALGRYLEERGPETAGSVYACDLAGFILNGVEANAATLLSVRLAEQAGCEETFPACEPGPV